MRFFLFKGPDADAIAGALRMLGFETRSACETGDGLRWSIVETDADEAFVRKWMEGVRIFGSYGSEEAAREVAAKVAKRKAGGGQQAPRS